MIGAIQPNDTSQPSAQEIAALIDQLREEGVEVGNVPDSE
ncbi:MAG: zinc ABC transporter substrate-binding protein [Caldilineaceae bacterium SB0661_bin_32]|uniref:Zinc ABC transporter substrate-binding protein n=1 Tax=Caldilineaceae bacterium SB0661_bin_32 TaxID=2605255 RepID=A0A6B1DAT7_9CHLR|nr:zinc ABC transporter substrate-binding protein [Caldilineaceae bacterium SB0661_bin_32]